MRLPIHRQHSKDVVIELKRSLEIAHRQREMGQAERFDHPVGSARSARGCFPRDWHLSVAPRCALIGFDQFVERREDSLRARIYIWRREIAPPYDSGAIDYEERSGGCAVPRVVGPITA